MGNSRIAEADATTRESHDPIWRMAAYRLAREVGEGAFNDAEAVRRRPLGYSIADQLLRSAHSIAANLAEGYSRGSGRDRVRFFEYALGSTRECIVWYLAARSLVRVETLGAQLDRLGSIRNILLAAIPRERRRTIDKAD